jgi:hypothetical protein
VAIIFYAFLMARNAEQVPPVMRELVQVSRRAIVAVGMKENRK